MKTLAFVVIEINPDAPAQASSTDAKGQAINPLTGETAQAFHIQIFPNAANGEAANLPPESLKTTLAHELGHVVARIANTKANREDPRTKPQGNRFVSDPADKVIESEREAWDIARMIAPDLDESEAKRNFESYADPSQKAEFEARLKSAILIEALIESLGKHDRSTVN
jgi:hypothetical protein